MRFSPCSEFAVCAPPKGRVRRHRVAHGCTRIPPGHPLRFSAALLPARLVSSCGIARAIAAMTPCHAYVCMHLCFGLCDRTQRKLQSTQMLTRVRRAARRSRRQERRLRVCARLLGTSMRCVSFQRECALGCETTKWRPPKTGFVGHPQKPFGDGVRSPFWATHVSSPNRRLPDRDGVRS